MTVEDKGKLNNPLKGSQVQSTIFQWVFTQCTVTVALLNCGMKAMSALLLPLSILGLLLAHGGFLTNSLALLDCYAAFGAVAQLCTVSQLRSLQYIDVIEKYNSLFSHLIH